MRLDSTAAASSARTWLTLIHDFLEQFGWLADSFVLDFYVDDHWSRLPGTWRAYLPTLTPEQLADLIDLDEITGAAATSISHAHQRPPPLPPPPLSLLAFKASVRLLSFPRSFAGFSELKQRSRSSHDEEEETERSSSSNTTTLHNPDLRNLFTRHVKLKKRHELERLTDLVSTLAEETGATHVFDIGGGLGHLSRYLAYGAGLSLTCVDGEQKFAQAATKLDTELKSFMDKKKTSSRLKTRNKTDATTCEESKDVDSEELHLLQLPPPPTHITLMLELDKHEEAFSDHPTPFGLTGLHSCGNLSPVVLHNFVNSPARFVVSLGCCYMKLDKRGFPLSRVASSLPRFQSLSYEALEVACHAIEQYCQRLRGGQVNKLLTHSYRATLETILVKRRIKRAGLRGVPHSERLTFKEYALRATAPLFPTTPLTPSELETPMIASHLSDWFKVVLFYSLRLLTASVVETAVLLDRAVFLTEGDNNTGRRGGGTTSTTNVHILPVFDPELSPRNIAIVAWRENIQT